MLKYGNNQDAGLSARPASSSLSMADFRINTDAASSFLKSLSTHLASLERAATEEESKFTKEFINAVDNVRRAITVLPKIMGGGGAENILKDAMLLVDMADVSFRFLMSDLKIIWNFIESAFTALAARDKGDTLRLGVSLYAALQAHDTDDDIVSRAAKRLSQEFEAFRVRCMQNVSSGADAKDQKKDDAMKDKQVNDDNTYSYLND